jgi:large subunit ribosomal protein L27
MSHTKAGGSSKNGRDSQSKRLGNKLFGGQTVKTGGIIVRQRGTKFEAGNGTRLGKDYTIFASTDGLVEYSQKRIKKFTSNKARKTVVSVVK